MKVDPTVVLELLDDSLRERDNARSNVVPDDKEMPKSRVYYFLFSDLKKRGLLV